MCGKKATQGYNQKTHFQNSKKEKRKKGKEEKRNEQFKDCLDQKVYILGLLRFFKCLFLKKRK